MKRILCMLGAALFILSACTPKLDYVESEGESNMEASSIVSMQTTSETASAASDAESRTAVSGSSSKAGKTSSAKTTVLSKAATADNRWDSKSHTSTNVVAVDELGRTVPAVSGYKKDRYVGLFYFTWLGQQGEVQSEVYNIEEALKSDPNALMSINSSKYPNNVPYFFAEPLYGYYNNADPWVLRKHIEMFIAADIDFLALDFTNSLVYPNVWPVLLGLLNEYQNAGWKVPKIVIFTKTNAPYVVNYVYENIYSNEIYKDLWFYGPYNKPLIIAEKTGLSAEVQNFFYFRPPQWPNESRKENGFPYVDWTYPQPTYQDLMSVSVAQHTAGAFSFSYQGNLNRGRGFSYATGKNVAADVNKGTNFQAQWDNVLKNDPKITFITGWNEWVALKGIWDNKHGVWVDTFNIEYSRDIEMTKGGYGDNYYLQMIQNIRAYKGIKGKTSAPVSQTIDIHGDITQWNTVSNVYLNMATEKIKRMHSGFLVDIIYTQEKPANCIEEARVTHDNDNLYFYVETKSDITAHKAGATNWMNLFIGVDGSKETSWKNFQYVVNRYPGSNGKTSLEASTGGFQFKKTADVEYTVNGKVMQIKIPKKLLGISGNQYSIFFKLADSIEKPEDMMDYYVSGESMPLGRLAYSYRVGQ